MGNNVQKSTFAEIRFLSHNRLAALMYLDELNGAFGYEKDNNDFEKLTLFR